MSVRQFDPAEPELMDVAEAVTPELEKDLDNLRLLNRWFGSHRLIRHYLRRQIIPGRPWRLLDLCTGSADIPRHIVDWTRQHGCEVTIDAVDFQPSTLEVARRLCAGYPEIQCLAGDAREFAAPLTYDGVFCSLALHHFSEEDATRILRRMRELSHGFALAADLERSWLTTLGVWFITATVFREPMTVYDARLSARRAFSREEFVRLMAAAGWENTQYRHFLYGRQAMFSTG